MVATWENIELWESATVIGQLDFLTAPDGARAVSKKGEIWECHHLVVPGEPGVVVWVREDHVRPDGRPNMAKGVVGRPALIKLWQGHVLRALPRGGITQDEMDYVRRSILGGE